MNSPGRRPLRRTAKRWTILVAAQLVIVTAALEVGARLYWKAAYGVPVTRPADVVYIHYPELKQLHGVEVSDRDSVFDIALLGGSVLHRNFGDVSERIGATAAKRGTRPVRVFNLAMPSQTTLDSRYKVLETAGAAFDLVLVYHGINETRANACPPELFREDYSHWSWYRHVANYSSHRGQLQWTALPFTLRHLWLDLEVAAGGAQVIPHDQPPREWFEFAAEVKTAGPYRRNLESIIQHSGRVLLVTFAWYVAPGYTEDRFEAHTLDYGRHTSPIELWGDPRWVSAGIEINNGITREVATVWPNARLVDLAATMPRSAATFDDVCHLTDYGCTLFAEAVMPAIIEAMSLPSWEK